jgi:hypothetical protein
VPAARPEPSTGRLSVGSGTTHEESGIAWTPVDRAPLRPRRGIEAWPPLRRAWFVSRALIGTQPRLLALLRFGPRTPPEYLVSAESGACIEGFPRSGNTFAARYFRQFNPGVRIAHHIHLPAQLLLAIRYGVPRILLVRRPRDCVLSMLVAYDGVVGPDLALRNYISFHRCLLPHLDEIPVCPFDELIAAPEEMVRRLNERFGTGFGSRRLTEADAAGLKREMLRSAERRGTATRNIHVPTAEKEERKLHWAEAVDNHRLLGHANAIHDRLLEASRHG